MIKLSTLKKNPGNPRQIKGEKLDKLKASVGGFQKMMALRPMIVDENNIVIGGNMRLTRPADNKIQQNKKRLIEALEKSLGVVTTACKTVGLDRGTFYIYYNKDAAFKAAVDDIENIALDFAESQLHKQIQNGEVSSTIFYLKTKGKHRGYIEKQQTELTAEVNITGDLSIKIDKIYGD